jgi:hypothetical protein
LMTEDQPPATAGGFGPVSLNLAVRLWRKTVIWRDEASPGRTFTQREIETSKLRERSCGNFVWLERGWGAFLRGWIRKVEDLVVLPAEQILSLTTLPCVRKSHCGNSEKT